MSDEKPVQLTKVGVFLPMSIEMLEDQKPGPPGHYEVHRKTPEWLAARAAFVAEYEAMQLRGIQLGYLEREPCYECGGEMAPTEHVEDYEWVFDE